ncbi:MAG: helix-turn-helix transcriptional regulator [Proteobacteria bacterium]|nr:helix-turn-helix transcriptional regulator [Pseudomonadota bacterium]MBS0598889.1 helix-turn-helix transcriptional regulator [Pseudomonadota bacterium]
MSPSFSRGSPFPRRLKQARKAAALSQKQLGVLAGIDEFVASPRINRYEQGVHQPDFDTATRLAKVLRVPLAYLFAQDDRLAEMILAFAALPKRQQEAWLRSKPAGTDAA